MKGILNLKTAYVPNLKIISLYINLNSITATTLKYYIYAFFELNTIGFIHLTTVSNLSNKIIVLSKKIKLLWNIL